MLPELRADQFVLLQQPPGQRLFLHGPAGCGKTTAAAAYLHQLLQQGAPGEQMLVLMPQRTLAAPYQQALEDPALPPGSPPALLTLGGLARRTIEWFWPLVAAEAGFAAPEAEPVFLTLETTQYYMARLVRPLLDQNFFSSIVMDRNRLYSQIVDNLNKAAVVGFPHTEIGARLSRAWSGDPAQLRVYQDVQFCAAEFRRYCMEHNLLDFSLQVELFWQFLWPNPTCQTYLSSTYRHIIADNLEEDTPVTHDLLRAWLPQVESALLVYDEDAGYRSFLGADPQSAWGLQSLCDFRIRLADSFVCQQPVQALAYSLGAAIAGEAALEQTEPPGPTADLLEALAAETQRFYPEMLDWTAEQIRSLVFDYGTPPGEIAVLTPFLSDSLRFALAYRLEQFQIPTRTHRPSRSLREEAVTQCLFTLALLAHPEWALRLPPTRFDLAYALMQAIDELDLVRAQLLVERAYRLRQGRPELLGFAALPAEVQERVGYLLGERFDLLRAWLLDYQQSPAMELDHFLSRLFGEMLSQPGFGFQRPALRYLAGEITSNLIESIQKFRWSIPAGFAWEEGWSLGLEYLDMVQQGVLAAQYLRSWQPEVEATEAVLLAPATTFLLANRPVSVQFWLDVGSRAWFERLYQPLTQPYVLSRAWAAERTWGDDDEQQLNQMNLLRLTTGLLRRCRSRVYLGLSLIGEQGYEERGPLLRAFQRTVQSTSGAP